MLLKIMKYGISSYSVKVFCMWSVTTFEEDYVFFCILLIWYRIDPVDSLWKQINDNDLLRSG